MGSLDFGSRFIIKFFLLWIMVICMFLLFLN